MVDHFKSISISCQNAYHHLETTYIIIIFTVHGYGTPSFPVFLCIVLSVSYSDTLHRPKIHSCRTQRAIQVLFDFNQPALHCLQTSGGRFYGDLLL